MKKVLFLLGVGWFAVGGVLAKEKEDAPPRYLPISQLEKAMEEAKEKNRLIVVLVAGRTADSCPNCTTSIQNGERAIGSGVVKVFARAEALNSSKGADFPAALMERVNRKFTMGASVTFLVFTPDLSELIAEASRTQLQNNKAATSDFRKQVADHKKELK